ncbi:hypothetical protein [Streptomyces reniochalinae]|uniref:hypothetical protein n=1 Tax=Streptomyces reniochalinae TaxID=2250578 RepID=UPI0015F0344D|nr:hypothetical protein [Streptomyces reniochalinae]
MAKNAKTTDRQQARRQGRTAEQRQQEQERARADDERATTGDVSRKGKQRRFGHN